jgi:anti-sigma factor RsiW
MNNEHPDTLPWFVAGTLEPAESENVSRHIERCTVCREEVEALSSMRQTLRMHTVGDADGTTLSLDGSAATAPVRRFDYRKLGLLAATIAVGILLSFFLLESGRHEPPGGAVPRQATLTPTLRSDASTPRIQGTGDWMLTVVLPTTASPGTYAVSISPPGAIAVSESSEFATDDQLRLTVQVELPQTGDYTFTALGAEGQRFDYTIAVEGISAPETHDD